MSVRSGGLIVKAPSQVLIDGIARHHRFFDRQVNRLSSTS